MELNESEISKKIIASSLKEPLKFRERSKILRLKRKLEASANLKKRQLKPFVLEAFLKKVLRTKSF